MSDSVANARQTIQRLAAIPEAPMRRRVFYKHLLRHGLDEACVFVDTLVRDTLHKKKPAVESYEALLDPDVIVETVGSERLDMMVARSREIECYASVLWLLAPAQRSDGEEVALKTLLHRDLRELTLGHRRSLARKARGDELDKLLSDPDPIVIGHLLANPAMTEQQVIALSARRPTVSSALEVVMDTGWIRRYRVKTALAQNPYLNSKRATVLLPLLHRRDIRSIAHDQTLSVDVRECAQHLGAMWNDNEFTS
ncbi:MAG: hypothetical protein AAFY60_17605 [Myxococcota bacterium]